MKQSDMTEQNPMAPVLKQRGQASVNFFSALAKAASPLRQKANAYFSEVIEDPGALPDDLDARHAAMTPHINKCGAFRVHQLSKEWHARYHGVAAIEAFNAASETLVPKLKALEAGPAQVIYDQGARPPAYWDGVNFHRTSGGWNGHAYQGYIHSEIVHGQIVEAVFPGGLAKQRRFVAALAPKDHYASILDMGCSAGQFTRALAEAYPDADISGVDLSAKTLEQAQRVANANGWGWKLFERPAEDTGFEENSFDLVTSYILLHEVPRDVMDRILAEAFRVLKPGGDLLFSDVTRFSNLDKLAEWQADHDAKYGGEPHWRGSASQNLASLAKTAGFEQVDERGIEPRSYPHVLSARKPLK